MQSYEIFGDYFLINHCALVFNENKKIKHHRCD